MSHPVAFLALVLLSFPAVGRAQDPPPPFDAPAADPDTEARALYTNGQRLYEEGRYEQAIVAFERAYALSNRPALLFNLANAYERLGQLEPAIDALTRYRVFAPVADQDVLLARVQALERRLQERPDTPVPVTAGVIQPAPTMPAPLPDRPPRRSPAPWILAGAGLAATVAGSAVAGGTWAASRGYIEDGERERWEQTRPLNNAGFGTAIAGGVVGVTGLVWGVTRP